MSGTTGQARRKRSQPGDEEMAVRRARRGDLAAIVELVTRSSQSKLRVNEADVTEWLFGKGLWVATAGMLPVGVAAWQAENLVSITDVFHVSPARFREKAGSRLLATIEAEANVLMCEANVVVLPGWTSKAVRTFLHKQGYEPRPYDELHRIWREVLKDFVGGGEDLMIKQLRERMVMAPV